VQAPRPCESPTPDCGPRRPARVSWATCHERRESRRRHGGCLDAHTAQLRFDIELLSARLRVQGVNREAFARLPMADKRFVSVPGATHLFEEPGTLEQVARLAADWFTRTLGE